MTECTKDERILKIIDDARNLLFDKFGNIVFEEIPHRYTIDGREYTPVSSIIQKYENHFDAEAISKRKAEREGIDQQELLKQWKWTNRLATVLGSRTHEFAESYTNLMSGHKELICQQNKPQFIEEENWLVPTFPQEFAVKKFYDELPPNIHAVGAEFKLSTQYIENTIPICGTADILFYYDDPNGKKSGFIIGDWKTNRELIKDFARNNNKMMLPPFENFYDEPLEHYYLQFNLYQRMMESVGLNVIARRLVHLKNDGTYEVHKVPKIDDNIIDLVIKE